MKTFLTLFIISFFSFEAKTQHIIFAKDYNGSILVSTKYNRLTVCDTTYNGDYLMEGGFISDIGSSYAYAAVDQNGIPIWEKDSAVYGGLDFHEASFYSGLRTYDNGYAFCGMLTNYGVSNESAIFVLKTDSVGNEIWRKNILQFQRGEATSIWQANDSSLYLTGNVDDSSALAYKIFLLKLSPDGDSMFMNIYSIDNVYPEKIFKLNNGLLISGTSYMFDSTTLQSRNGYFLLSTDDLGNLMSFHVWFDSLYSINIGSVSKTPDNDLVISCSLVNSQGQGSIQIFKIDTATNIIWKKSILNIPYSPYCSGILPNGNIVSAYGNFQVMEMNPWGDTIWTRNFEDTIHGIWPPAVSSIFALDNSTFLISGGIYFSAPGGSVPYLMKVSNAPYDYIEEKQNILFQLFPNPAEKLFTVNMTGMEGGNLEIFNLFGEKIYNLEFENGKQKMINCETFPRGIYFVKLCREGSCGVRKLILQ